jgi:hypothetical protein
MATLSTFQLLPPPPPQHHCCQSQQLQVLLPLRPLWLLLLP